MKLLTLFCFWCFQEHYRKQLDFLNEANSIFDTDAIMNPILAERLKHLAFKVKDTKLL